MTIPEKYCRKCEKMLPLSEFYAKTGSPCKVCRRKLVMGWIEKNVPRIKPKRMKPDLPEGHKYCFKCASILPDEKFYKDTGSPCRKCHSGYLKEIRAREKERIY